MAVFSQLTSVCASFMITQLATTTLGLIKMPRFAWTYNPSTSTFWVSRIISDLRAWINSANLPITSFNHPKNPKTAFGLNTLLKVSWQVHFRARIWTLEGLAKASRLLLFSLILLIADLGFGIHESLAELWGRWSHQRTKRPSHVYWGMW